MKSNGRIGSILTTIVPTIHSEWLGCATHSQFKYHSQMTLLKGLNALMGNTAAVLWRYSKASSYLQNQWTEKTNIGMYSLYYDWHLSFSWQSTFWEESFNSMVLLLGILMMVTFEIASRIDIQWKKVSYKWPMGILQFVKMQWLQLEQTKSRANKIESTIWFYNIIDLVLNI